MLLNQLRGFVEVARLAHVTRAAEALFVTQPALTARLNALEQEVGQSLLVRSRRGVRLTEAGRAFLPYAQRAVTAADEGEALLAAFRKGRSSRLVIGATPAVSTYVLPRVLRSYRDSHPEVHVSVRTGHSEEVLAMVLREDVQLGLARALQHADIESQTLYEDELVFVVEPKHPFAKRDKIALAELASEHLILFDRTSSYHDLTHTLFRAAGVLTREVMELDNAEAAKKMVQEGLGVALLPRTAVAEALADRTLRAVTIADARPVKRKIVATWRRDAPHHPAIPPLLRLFRPDHHSR